MSLIIRPKLKCPHCGNETATMLTIDSVIMNHFFIRCDLEDGGCDELYAIEVNIKPVVTVWKLQTVVEEPHTNLLEEEAKEWEELEPCYTCEGRGWLPESEPAVTLSGRNPCKDCGGAGRVEV